MQGYAVDIIYDDGSDDSVRFTASWSEVDTSIDGLLSEDQLIAVAVNGILEIFENSDRHLERLTDAE